ncbi:hypothetical protein [Bacillus toyonensis]|uniref:hypothetical protein n=1 Tax=Bacillus toyonensis TaxID=155322 RepID=UPI000BF715F3|nr:hypothetical protein [Bacillus toyonensis]PGF05124.1 hypothetical protein COM61_01495 [Bacillus toyonensis]
MTEVHKCNNGQKFDKQQRKLVPCEICKRERKNEVRDGILNEQTGNRESLSVHLGIDQRYVSDMYSPDTIIGKTDLYYLEDNSVHEFNAVVEAIMAGLTGGQLPTTSFVMYAGRHAELQKLAYCFLASAYKGLLTVGRVLTAREIRVNKYKEDFDEYYKKDIIVVIMTDDADSVTFGEVQGFMQERSLNNKPTIVLLSNRRNFTLTIGRLCSLSEERYDLGVFIGVNYKQGLDMSEETIKIATKAFKVSNETLGTTQRLEDIMRIPNENLKTTDAEMQSFDMEKFTKGNLNFNGKGS